MAYKSRPSRLTPSTSDKTPKKILNTQENQDLQTKKKECGTAQMDNNFQNKKPFFGSPLESQSNKCLEAWFLGCNAVNHEELENLGIGGDERLCIAEPMEALKKRGYSESDSEIICRTCDQDTDGYLFYIEFKTYIAPFIFQRI